MYQLTQSEIIEFHTVTVSKSVLCLIIVEPVERGVTLVIFSLVTSHVYDTHTKQLEIVKFLVITRFVFFFIRNCTFNSCVVSFAMVIKAQHNMKYNMNQKLNFMYFRFNFNMFCIFNTMCKTQIYQLGFFKTIQFFLKRQQVWKK